jgi:toxin CptA
VSSRSEVFQCQWRPSSRLLLGYALVQGLAWLSLALVDIPYGAMLLGWLACLAHGLWVVPRHLLLSNQRAYTGLRHDGEGWQVFSAAAGWQPIEVHRDSLALPLLVVLRFRLPARRGVKALCIASDSLPRQQHRRLRVRLKFSRRRRAAAG